MQRQLSHCDNHLQINITLLLLFFVATLQITDLQHSVTSPMSFRLEYKRGSTSGSSTPTSMFQRQVRMQVDISHISKAESGPEALYAITFTLLSGEIKTQILIAL